MNDMEECQGRETIQDTTVVGPKVDKYRSLLSLDSIQTQVRGTFLEISTGNIADFAFLEGAYDARCFLTIVFVFVSRLTPASSMLRFPYL